MASNVAYRHTKVERVRVTWPSGRVDTIGPLAANQIVTVREGAWLVGATPFQPTPKVRP